jgi:hypothetical protein
MTSNEDRLEDTKHEIKKKLEKIERRLYNMRRLDERKTGTIKELKKTDASNTGKVLIAAKQADISKKQEDLAQAEEDWKSLKETCDGQQLSIQAEKDRASHVKTQISEEKQFLEDYKLQIIQNQEQNVELETQIKKVNG